MRSHEFINESPELAEKYKAHLIKTLPLLMNFLSKTSKEYLPTEDEMLDVIETGYEVMLQYGDVNKAGEVVRNKLKSLISKEGVEEDTDYDNDKPLRLRANTDRVQKFIEAVYTRYPETFQNNHVMSWGSGNEQEIALFELIPNMNKPNAVEIKWIQAYPLRQGIGSRAMKILQSMAREHDVILTLYPWDKGQISQSKLIKFYRQMGFKPTTKGSKNMIWQGVSEGVTESATVTRIDSKLITDFSSNLNTYKHTDDWSQSGLDTGDNSYWSKRNIKPNTSKGLFAGDPHRTALYATGNPNETRYVEYTENGQPVVYFDKKDLPAIRGRKTYLSVFDASDFRKLPSGEWFSEHPGKPIKQIPINDPFKYIESQGWKIRITNDLNKVLKKVQQLQKVGKIDHYGAEGMNESKQGVSEGSYVEGGSITHDGVEYDFDSVMSIAEKMPTKTCSVDKLSWILQYDTPNKDRLERADITVPLIVTKSVNGKLAAIDGLHRLAKAVRDNVKTLPVKYIKPSELESAKLNKQGVEEDWSKKYKRSINCNNPRGFSQRAHCQGRKKRGKSK